MRTYYEILGVRKDSTQNEIKRSFRKLSMSMHPDKGGDEKTYVEILNAYEVLSNEEKRRDYDVSMKQKAKPIAQCQDKPLVKSIDDTTAEVILTLDEAMNGCLKTIYYGNDLVEVKIDKGIRPMCETGYFGKGFKRKDGTRANLFITPDIVLPKGFTFEKCNGRYVLAYNVKCYGSVPQKLRINLCGETKVISVPQNMHNGSYLKVRNFGYWHNGKRDMLYIKIVIL